MSAAAAYAASPFTTSKQLTATANTNRDGTTGTYTLVRTVSANGELLERIELVALNTTTAGMIRLFLSSDAGTTKQLWKEFVVGIITQAASSETWKDSLCFENGFPLEFGQVIYASVEKAETFIVHLTGGKF